MENSEECCLPFDPKPWREKTVKWKDKKFVTDSIRSFFHIPINFGKVVVKNVKLLEEAGAKNPENIMIVDEKSLWGSDIYIAVDKDVPGAKMATLSGTFMTKVYEGSFKKMKSWINDMTAYVKSKGKGLKKMYFSYTTCPACAKKYGKNYVVIFAKIA